MIYDNVKNWADQRKISIAELERQAELGNGTIGGWKVSNPNLDSLSKVAKALNVSVTTLLKEK